jgi:two-component system, NarL family, nitrate/nitrite response regulator NarL
MLDGAALVQLRAVVRQLSDPTSLADVVRLAGELRVRSGLTVDFEATRELGQPMIVVRSAPAVLPTSSLAMLTPREREVAALISAGQSNKQIARTLGLSVGTVKHYVHQILEKTGLAGRVAIAQAHRDATAFGADSLPIFG